MRNENRKRKTKNEKRTVNRGVVLAVSVQQPATIHSVAVWGRGADAIEKYCTVRLHSCLSDLRSLSLTHSLTHCQ